MPRGIPNRKPPDADDDNDKGLPLRSRLPAGSQPPPATSGASSVFAIGRQAKPAAAARFAVDDVQIRSGVPVPPPQVGKGAASPYATLLDRMKPGDMVELPYRQGYGLLSMAKKMKIAVTRRTLKVGMLSIWRT
jgi:hypothetical protein